MNTKEPLISVIIPVYNSAKYISKCLNSVINQSFNNIEIICIDDASKDKSLSIINKYASKDSRIRVFSNETNMGAGYSRNFALDNAKGKYIYFLDSDDWLEKDGLSKLANALKQFGNVDVVAFLHYSVNATTHIKHNFPDTPQELTNRIINIYDTPECIQYLGYGMTKLLRRQLLEQFDIKFNNDKCFEDVAHFLDLAPKAKSIVFINEKIFNYRISRQGSVISKQDKYINYLVQDTRKAKEISKNFDSKVRIELLKKIYSTLAYTALISYSNFKLPHSALKNIFDKEIDYNFLKENNMNYYAYMHNRILNTPEKIFLIENFFKMKIKKFFPTFFEVYRTIKSMLIKK